MTDGIERAGFLNQHFVSEAVSSRRLADLASVSVSGRCQVVQEEAAVRALRPAQPHRLHHVVRYSDHNPHEVCATVTLQDISSGFP